jgi:hypothetical protein
MDSVHTHDMAPAVPEVSAVANIQAPFSIKKTPCPVTDENRVQWTATERQQAASAVEANTLDELQTLVCIILRIMVLVIFHLFLMNRLTPSLLKGPL